MNWPLIPCTGALKRKQNDIFFLYICFYQTFYSSDLIMFPVKSKLSVVGCMLQECRKPLQFSLASVTSYWRQLDREKVLATACALQFIEKVTVHNALGNAAKQVILMRRLVELPQWYVVTPFRCCMLTTSNEFELKYLLMQTPWLQLSTLMQTKKNSNQFFLGYYLVTIFSHRCIL